MGVLVRDVMQTQVVTIEADASLLDAQRLFVEEEINGAPVVDTLACFRLAISRAAPPRSGFLEKEPPSR